MRFTELSLAGAFVIDLEPHPDERGFFARCFAEEEFAQRGLTVRFPHCNLSRNLREGTLRGMHYAVAPSEESKVVRCTTGAICDVIVDIRRGSPTFGRWERVELTAENGRAVYIPAGLAHGFLTLVDHTDVFYQMGDIFRPGTARGFRWNDETFAIEWPHAPRVISARDAGYPGFSQEP
jgi:dTDP-4-dehydrorhamnose 3,5-epimerase